MILYIDLFFILNLLMDSMIAICLMSLYRKKVYITKILAASGGGSIGACVYIICSNSNIIEQIIYYGIIGFYMTIILFGLCPYRKFIKYFLSLSAIALIFAGTLSFLYFNGLHVLIISGIISFTIIWNTCNYFSKLKCITSRCNVSLFLGNKFIDVPGIIDTGNTLVEPYGGRDVHVLEQSVMDNLLSDNDSLGGQNHFMLIPFHSVGRENGLLKGYILDKMMIYNESGGVEEIDKPVVAVYSGILSTKNDYKILVNGKGR